MLSLLEELEDCAYDNGVDILCVRLPHAVQGLYYADRDCSVDTITLSSAIETNSEKASVLAEELGHHFTTSCNLFEAPEALQQKFERYAACWAVEAVMPPEKLIQAWQAGAGEPWNLAEYLGISERFVRAGLGLYRERYGEGLRVQGHIITFNLLRVCREKERGCKHERKEGQPDR